MNLPRPPTAISPVPRAECVWLPLCLDISGLAAANTLRLAGLDCIVLEGRHRAGGRVFSATIGKSFSNCAHTQPDCGCVSVELGAQWVHNLTDANPIYTLANARRPRFTQTSCDDEPADDVKLFDASLGRWLTDEERDVAFNEWLKLKEHVGDSDVVGPDDYETDSLGYHFRHHVLDGFAPGTDSAMLHRVVAWCLERVGIAGALAVDQLSFGVCFTCLNL